MSIDDYCKIAVPINNILSLTTGINNFYVCPEQLNFKCNYRNNPDDCKQYQQYVQDNQHLYRNG